MFELPGRDAKINQLKKRAFERGVKWELFPFGLFFFFPLKY